MLTIRLAVHIRKEEMGLTMQHHAIYFLNRKLSFALFGETNIPAYLIVKSAFIRATWENPWSFRFFSTCSQKNLDSFLQQSQHIHFLFNLLCLYTKTCHAVDAYTVGYCVIYGISICAQTSHIHRHGLIELGFVRIPHCIPVFDIT